jgi:hypothetical protein
VVSWEELRRRLAGALGIVGGRLSGGVLVRGVCWGGEAVEGEGRGRRIRWSVVKLTSDLFASLEAWISAICFSVRFLLLVSLLVWQKGRAAGVVIGDTETYISLSINSNRPSTAITASVFSCLSSTGPTSL